MCEIVSGNSWAVSPNGAVSGCVLFAPSIQAYESDLLRDCRSTMVVGNVSDPGVGSRMAEFGENVSSLPIMSEKEKKYSSYRRCVDCRFFSVCVTCPASIGFVEGNTDPHRVPDYYCAFNYVALASRDGFPVQPTDMEVIRGDKYLELREKWRRTGERARREA
jgi:radical SAM protein with 4Fe4S-binding SPASM domain